MVYHNPENEYFHWFKRYFENEFFNFDNLPTQNIVSTKEAMSDLPEAISSNDHIEYSKPPTNNFQNL